MPRLPTPLAGRRPRLSTPAVGRRQVRLNASAIISTVAVCDGRDHLGDIEQRADGFRATTITGERLGVFKTMAEAMRAFPSSAAS
jgi:hypothetical protein